MPKSLFPAKSLSPEVQIQKSRCFMDISEYLTSPHISTSSPELYFPLIIVITQARHLGMTRTASLFLSTNQPARHTPVSRVFLRDFPPLPFQHVSPSQLKIHPAITDFINILPDHTVNSFLTLQIILFHMALALEKFLFYNTYNL